jgi:hypothetical protein
LKNVHSNLILFGYCAGTFFEDDFDSADEFAAAEVSYQTRVDEEKKSTGS